MPPRSSERLEKSDTEAAGEGVLGADTSRL